MDVLLDKLHEIEPNATFEARLPRILSSSGATYFAKTGSPSEAEQYTGEACSLNAMNEVAPGIAPRVFVSGITEAGVPYFISEFKDMASLYSNTIVADELAERMASEMHAHPNPDGFGFPVPTYCGPTRLQNGMFKTWHECYGSQIGDLLRQLHRKGRYLHLCRKGEIIKNEVIPKLLGCLEIQPVILHGDLWCGNVGVDRKTGRPVVYDPASYYGHNEADLSIARIFGGFPGSFYETYHEYRPKTEPADQYNLRLDLYELFHYLNHTLIFGGSYARTAETRMDTLIAALPELGCDLCKRNHTFDASQDSRFCFSI